MRVLHITAHLGGGVGKAHAAMAEAAAGSPVEHRYLLLEPPRDLLFAERIRAAGCPIHVAPDADRLAAWAEEADVVQIEWWNHPRLYTLLAANDLPEIRLVTWVHISGLAPPLVPRGLTDLTDKILFTSPCSFAAANLRPAIIERPEAFGVIKSGFGLGRIKRPTRRPGATLRFGYLGTLDFLKMNPEFFDYIDSIDADLCVHLWGRYEPEGEVARRAAAMHHPERVRFEGFADNPAQVLARLDVLIYLLASDHYGTGENVLVEALSAGAVPVVLDNPAEACIVADRRNGFVIRSKQEFAACIAALVAEPAGLAPLRAAARADAARLYDPRRSVEAFEQAYASAMRQPKRRRDFAAALGHDARSWFLSSMTEGREPKVSSSRHLSGVPSKSSLGHFRHCLPADESLASLAN